MENIVEIETLAKMYDKADCENRILPEGFQCNYEPDDNSMLLFVPKDTKVKIAEEIDKEILRQALINLREENKNQNQK